MEALTWVSKGSHVFNQFTRSLVPYACTVPLWKYRASSRHSRTFYFFHAHQSHSHFPAVFSFRVQFCLGVCLTFKHGLLSAVFTIIRISSLKSTYHTKMSTYIQRQPYLLSSTNSQSLHYPFLHFPILRFNLWRKLTPQAPLVIP
jgi:hypothetical protein